MANLPIPFNILSLICLYVAAAAYWIAGVAR